LADTGDSIDELLKNTGQLTVTGTTRNARRKELVKNTGAKLLDAGN
jgi:hypothetical protein